MVSTPILVPSFTNSQNGYRKKDKVVVIMGSTGSGKSRLSIDLATRFSGEVINCDKIQFYTGLDISTNKISSEEQLGVPHHLLGEVDSSSEDELTPAQFRSCASELISQIVGRGNMPYIVGGSNSYIYALLAKSYSPGSDVFNRSDPVCTELRYDCCFLWLDVSLSVLNEYLRIRVDQMVDSGMVEELAKYHESPPANRGLMKSIGVPEFERYFKNKQADDEVQEGLFKEAVKAVKDNTCDLAKTQVGKIQQLRAAGWGINRLDGTDTFRALVEGSKGWSVIWKRDVVEPSLKLVKSFLEK